MKIRLEVEDGICEDEIIIRCKQITGQIQKLQKLISEESAEASMMTFYKENQEFYFPLKNILFFETSESYVYAHTRNDTFRIKFRLYELENFLPRVFVRISKSTIVNVKQILIVSRNLTSSSLI